MKIDLKIIKDYWPIAVAVVAFIGSCAVFPVRLSNAESDIESLEEGQKILMEQTTTIGSWIKQEQQSKEFEKERLESAPPGWRWDKESRKYVKR